MIIAFLCLFFLIINLQKKKNIFTFILFVALMWLIMTFITGNADEAVYISRYSNISLWKGNSEFLFQLLIIICNKIGLSFIQFKGLISLIILGLVSTTIWKLSKYPNIVLSMYFLCPFPLNVSQIRFALASALFIYGYKYIVDSGEKDKKIFGKIFTVNDIKFAVIVIVAAMIHTVAIFWMSLLLIKKITVKQTVWVTIGFSVFIYFIFNPGSVEWILHKLGAYTRMYAYFTQAYQDSEYRHIGVTSISVLYTSILCILSCVLIRKRVKYHTQICLLEKVNIFMLSLFSFILRFTSEMYRPQEGLMLLNYITITNEFDSNQLLKLKGKNTYIFLNFILVLLVLGAYILKIYLYNVDSIWKPMFFI